VKDLNGIAFVDDPAGPELWIASSNGATIVRLPMEDTADVQTLDPENSPMASKDVVSIAAGKDSTRWIATNKGISARYHERWLTPAYDLHYPDVMFGIYPITSMATNEAGDTLYVGTAGAGVARIYKDQVDGISGASVYAIWGPINLPSDNIQSVYIAPDGTQWFGTTDGIARHTGNNTLDKWTVFTTEDGLVDNFVQAIISDMDGNIWFGTKGGISVFDGSAWVAYTTDNGLASNNVLSLAMDLEGIIWIGTDTGISSYEKGKFITH
jgi:ligand-binding sensor domain-containing protein